MQHTTTRLNKHLALVMGISRREADDLIAHGNVTINRVVATLGSQIELSDSILVNGTPVSNETALQYIMLNKPVGYVCSRRAQGENPTIYDLLPPEYKSLKSVGRLDKDSSGLLILTNDGDFAHHMTHPSFYKTKVYNVVLDRNLEPLHQQMIGDYGIKLPDGVSRLELMRLSDTDRKNWQVTMHEGRNRQIRRTFAAVGYTVTNLHRTTFGSFTLGDVATGRYIPIKQ